MSLPALSLKVRLGLGAALLAAGAIFASVALYSGMTRVAESLNSALAAEQRMSRYAVLSTQVSTFLVIATEAIQTGIAHDDRKQRLSPAVEKIGSTFSDLREGLEIAVADAEHLGIDQQARYGTQSLGIARMEALLDSSLRGLSRDTDDPAVLRAHIDSFASAFDPLLNDSVNAEVRFRAEILEGIGQLKESLTRTAILVGLGSLLLVPILYVWLVRPQFRRLDRLKSAAQMIAVEDFSLHLPETSHDEIGNVFIETANCERKTTS